MLISKHNNTQLVATGERDIKTLVENIKFKDGQLRHAGPFNDLSPENVARIYKIYKSSTVSKAKEELTQLCPSVELHTPFYVNFPPHVTEIDCPHCGIPMVEFIHIKGHKQIFKDQHKICPLCNHSKIKYKNGQSDICYCQNCCYEKAILNGEPFVEYIQPNPLSCYDILCLYTFLGGNKYEVKSISSFRNSPNKQVRTEPLLLSLNSDYLNPLSDETELQVLGHLLNNGFLRPDTSEYGKLPPRDSSCNTAYSDGKLYFQRRGAIFTLTLNNVTITHANKLDTLKALREQFRQLLNDGTAWGQIDLLYQFTKLANFDCKSIQLHNALQNHLDEHLTHWIDSVDVDTLRSASLLDIESVVGSLNKYPKLQTYEGVAQHWHTFPELVLANKALVKVFNRELKRKLHKSSASAQLSKYKQSTLLTALTTLLLEWNLSMVDFKGRDLWQDNIAPKLLNLSKHSLPKHIAPAMVKNTIYSGKSIGLSSMYKDSSRSVCQPHAKEAKDCGLFITENQLIDLVYDAMLYGQVFLPQEIINIPFDLTPNEKKEYLAKRFIADNLRV
ncbi:hypothetical protein J7X25_001087 [Vibrio parahaemolyticus]|nr:hypothetical protein [Vibrio parahaemolyticus]EKA7377301.1 hypothetical protein [Vibrio parahaemolyticus]